jgi:hypothetical protein
MAGYPCWLICNNATPVSAGGSLEFARAIGNFILSWAGTAINHRLEDPGREHGKLEDRAAGVRLYDLPSTWEIVSSRRMAPRFTDAGRQIH